MPPLLSHSLRILTGDHDLPDDRFSDHVNNARYFAFINQTFHGWYVAMGIRDGQLVQGAMMAHLAYDFLSEVKPPATVVCRIEVSRVGRSSMEHSITVEDLGVGGADPPRLAGRGRTVHDWFDRRNKRTQPWPAEVLARCWPSAA
jgi:acyl-CoA thioester hydrolase